jgi:hypothetical protein
MDRRSQEELQSFQARKKSKVFKQERKDKI